MAIDAKKLKSFMSEREEDMEHEDEEGEEHEAMESPEEEAAEHEGADDEGDEDEVYEDFVSDVFTHASALEEAATAIEMALTHEVQPDADTVEQMKEQLAEMPESIQKGVAEYLMGVPYEEVVELAEELAEEDRIADVEQVAGWLYWIAKNVSA